MFKFFILKLFITSKYNSNRFDLDNIFKNLKPNKHIYFMYPIILIPYASVQLISLVLPFPLHVLWFLLWSHVQWNFLSGNFLRPQLKADFSRKDF